MSVFTEDQLDALRELAQLWPATPYSLIGAAGLTCQVEGYYRQTNDLDVSVAVSLDELSVDLGRLRGWRRHPRLEHEWQTPAGIKVDLIPAGPSHLAENRLVWPSGHSMSLVGLRHAFERAQSLKLAADIAVPVAPVAAIALLKMVAYQDRPLERERDLGDIAHVLEYYVPADDPHRYAERVMSASLMYEDVSSYLLGCDLREMLNAEERKAAESFISLARGDSDAGRTQALMIRLGPGFWRSHPQEQSQRIAALRRGLKGD